MPGAGSVLVDPAAGYEAVQTAQQSGEMHPDQAVQEAYGGFAADGKLDRQTRC